MKSLLTLVACLLVVFASWNIADAQTLQLTVANQTFSGSNFSFDIYMQATSGTVYLAGADLVLTFNSGNFTSPADTKGAVGTFVLNDVDGDNSTQAGGTVGALYRSETVPATITSNQIIINVQAEAIGDQTTFNSDVAVIDNNLYHFGTYTISGITTPTGTMGLAWKTSGSGVNTSVSTFANTTPWNQTTVTLSTPTIATGYLPVELSSFTALAQGRTINLAWQTKTEVNNSGFDVERQAVSTTASATSTWAKVGSVTGKGTTNTPQNYSFSDVVKNAGSYNYRLKQIDRNGSFTYSSEVAVKATLSPEDYKLSQNYPNPFNPSTKFNFAMKTTEHVAIKVYNSIGQEVVTLFDGVVPADQIQEVTFDGSRLSSGIYFYVLRATDRVEVKKMLMMK